MRIEPARKQSHADVLELTCSAQARDLPDIPIMSDIGAKDDAPGGSGGGGDDEPKRKKPCLKSPSSSDSSQPPGPNCLLVIGDALSTMVAFFDPRELCNIHMTCKSLRQIADQAFDRLVDEMNAKCDRVSVGRGSRTKLIRYWAAKEMNDQVRTSLLQHTSTVKRAIHGETKLSGSACAGCSAFPQVLGKSFFSSDGSNHEIFLCFYDTKGGEREVLFQGFVPASKHKYFPHTFDIPLLHFLRRSKWATRLTEVLEVSVSDQEANEIMWKEKWAKAGVSNDLAVVSIAVHKQTAEALLLGAVTGFGIRIGYAHNAVEMNPFLHVKCDVHGDITDPNPDQYLFGAAAADISLEFESLGAEKEFRALVAFVADKFHSP